MIWYAQFDWPTPPVLISFVNVQWSFYNGSFHLERSFNDYTTLSGSTATFNSSNRLSGRFSAYGIAPNTSEIWIIGGGGNGLTLATNYLIDAWAFEMYAK